MKSVRADQPSVLPSLGETTATLRQNLRKSLCKCFRPEEPAGMSARKGDNVLAEHRRERYGGFVWRAADRGFSNCGHDTRRCGPQCAEVEAVATNRRRIMRKEK